MKRITLSLLALTFAFTSLQAQEKKKRDHKPRTEKKAPANEQRITLTEDQKQKIKGIKDDHRTKIKELESKTATITVNEYRAEKNKLREAEKAQLKTVFTSEQQAQLEKNKHGYKGRKPGSHRFHHQKDLNLSAAQEAKIKEIRKDSFEKMKALKKNTSLTDEAKKNELSALRKAQRAQVMEVYTPEQKQKMQERRNYPMGK